ncbi:MAG: hypothetical protein AAGG75_04160 [Bacteroidota bacterium]
MPIPSNPNANTTTEEFNRALVRDGLQLLKAKKRYRQNNIIAKIKTLGLVISASTLSNIINGKSVAEETIEETAEKIMEIIKQELGMVLEKEAFIFDETDSGWEASIVPELFEDHPGLILKPGFSFTAEGRYEPNKKVELFSMAETEVIEFGLTMRTYASHFISKSDQAFRTPITQLLAKGVHIRCYLLDPECNEASMYFDDRAKVLKAEQRGISVIRNSLETLASVSEEFRTEGYPGHFEVYTYRHIPYNHFMSIDASEPTAKMLVSHYVYGKPRGKCPVMEFTQEHSPQLYRLYLDSLKSLTKGAKLRSSSGPL